MVNDMTTETAKAKEPLDVSDVLRENIRLSKRVEDLMDSFS
jgi:hypothetical protein